MAPSGGDDGGEGGEGGKKGGGEGGGGEGKGDAGGGGEGGGGVHDVCVHTSRTSWPQPIPHAPLISLASHSRMPRAAHVDDDSRLCGRDAPAVAPPAPPSRADSAVETAALVVGIAGVDDDDLRLAGA